MLQPKLQLENIPCYDKVGCTQINIYPSNTDFKSCEIFYCIVYVQNRCTDYFNRTYVFYTCITYALTAHDTDIRAVSLPSTPVTPVSITFHQME